MQYEIADSSKGLYFIDDKNITRRKRINDQKTQDINDITATITLSFN